MKTIWKDFWAALGPIGTVPGDKPGWQPFFRGCGFASFFFWIYLMVFGVCG